MRLLAWLAFFFSVTAIACDEGLVKTNYLQIFEHSSEANNMTEADFNKIISVFENHFMQMVERDLNSELVVLKAWSTSTVNAFAEKKPGKVLITIYGGLARHKQMTSDGLALTLCHELGHHLGGFPKKMTNTWSSAEGQSDYYAATKCLRRFWANDNNLSIMATVKIPELVMKECRLTFPAPQEFALCTRMAMASHSISLLMQKITQTPVEPKFETPDPKQVSTINYQHPDAQCRLDTLFQGAVCEADQEIEFDDDDEVQGSCHEKLGHTRGLRPGCWFVPST